MVVIEKAICEARELFPLVYANRRQGQKFHFAFIFKRNHLLSTGINDYAYNNKALKLAKKYNVKHYQKFPSLHAEISAISQLFGRVYIDSTMKMVVVRLNKFGEIRESRPCEHCLQVLNALDLTKIWYSNHDGKVLAI